MLQEEKNVLYVWDDGKFWTAMGVQFYKNRVKWNKFPTCFCASIDSRRGVKISFNEMMEIRQKSIEIHGCKDKSNEIVIEVKNKPENIEPETYTTIEAAVSRYEKNYFKVITKDGKHLYDISYCGSGDADPEYVATWDCTCWDYEEMGTCQHLDLFFKSDLPSFGCWDDDCDVCKVEFDKDGRIIREWTPCRNEYDDLTGELEEV